MKHIQFSKGFFFLGDMQEYVRQQQIEMLSNASNIRNEQLEFTYNLGDEFRIDIEAAKQRKEAREQESKKNFEELKKQMEQSANRTPAAHQNEKLQSSEVRQKPPQIEEDGDQIEDEVGDSFQDDDGIEDFYGDTAKEGTLKSKLNEQAADNATKDDLDDDDLDLDYSQTHLDDFLKSHTSSTMMKGSNI